MIKKYLWMLLLATGLQTSWGFALLGPLPPLPNGADAWETPVIGYGYAYTSYADIFGGPVFLGDIGGVRDIGQGYRRNIPFIYYTYDASFLDFFGSNGVAAVDSAVAIMNNLTNADRLDLTQYPMDSQNSSGIGTALYLTDLKSVTLHLLVEQMGLADPERFTWTLHDRSPGPACPLTTVYLVAMRNLEVTNTALNTVQFSAYVNNVLYTYEILEFCTGPDPLAYTLPYAVDPLADEYTAVADNDFDSFGGLQIGGFYNGLTRDDVAGLKYLLTTNNVNREMVTGSLLYSASTNYASPQQLFPVNPNILPTFPNTVGYGTFDLGSLLSFSTTNSPVLVAATYPGVVVANSQNYFILATNATVTAYYTNYIGSPIGSPPILEYATNYSYYPQERYITTFANIVTNYYQSNTPAILQTITTGPLIGAPVGSPAVSTTNYAHVTLTNWPSGSYYVEPSFGTNVCPAGILYTLQTNVIYTTNSLTVTSTNAVTTTNATVSSVSQSLITWYTNYTYVTYTVTCGQTANPVNLYQGIGKVQFIREDYDSLLGQFFQPVTFGYSMVAVTNSAYATVHLDRTVAAPEILLAGNDQGAANTFNGTVIRNITFDTSQILNGEAGPGAINPATTFSYNTIGTAFQNGDPYIELYNINFFLYGAYQIPVQTNGVNSVAWASFDDSTNVVLYPDGESIANLANQIIIQINPSGPLEATNGVLYSQPFTVQQTRLTLPLSWSATGLPPGLTMSTTGLLSGTPIDQTGGLNSPLIYDTTITVTDALMNSVQWYYLITVE